MKHRKPQVSLLLTLLIPCLAFAQNPANDSHTPLHLLQPDYTIPYTDLSPESIQIKTDCILQYLKANTLTEVENSLTHVKIKPSEIDAGSQLVRGSFRLASYEWGVTYAAMVRVSEVTGDAAYLQYARERMDFLSTVAPFFQKQLDAGKTIDPQMKQILQPHALDDAGAVCAAMCKVAVSTKSEQRYRSLIENYMQFVFKKEQRLDDGTFARNRPFRNTVWLDDMYMSLPAIAQYGIYTKQGQYQHQAATLITLFAKRMFVPEKNLFRHGWVEKMDPHPAFFWGRANGWAILTMCEVLDVLPKEDAFYDEILSLYRKHVSGLAALQSGTGFWHQLLDRNDTYPETSATAIFTYCIAHGVNKGWLDAKAYGPVAKLGWAAVSTKITAKGEVEGTCVGTGMGFDPAYYAHRPVSNAAAHGYGPALLAGAEVYQMLKSQHPRMNDSAVQFYQKTQQTIQPIFSEE
jgi:rhamnogalacturonyl hydrolase YesR